MPARFVNRPWQINWLFPPVEGGASYQPDRDHGVAQTPLAERWDSAAFADSFPVLGPYYPIPSGQLKWQENWTNGGYYGYWWP